MAGGGPSGFGQGGKPNVLPGRGYFEFGSDSYRDMPDDWVGGARGPAAIPSRVAPLNPAGSAPAPRDPRIQGFDVTGDAGSPYDATGQQGPIRGHRGMFVEDTGAPRLEFDNVYGHGSIPWARPFFPNVAGMQTFRAPTQMPSWSANAVLQQDTPTAPLPWSKRKIGNYTVRRPYGNTSSGQLFVTGPSLAQFIAGITQGMKQQGRRWMAHSKTSNPLVVNRSAYATAGSYGQTTTTLGSIPTNLPTSAWGAY